MIRSLWHSLLELFFPHLCVGCGKHLETGPACLCASCLDALPRTDHASSLGNKAEEPFRDITKVVRAVSFCRYGRDDTFMRLIRLLKYGRSPWIGVWLGERAAKEIMDADTSFFRDIDYIIPVPLHPARLRVRTYNQAECIAKGVSRAVALPLLTDALVRVVNNATQTRRSAAERLRNVEGIFALKQSVPLQDCHILLVDDILTTGATLKACIRALTPIRGLKITVLTLGITDFPSPDVGTF